MKFSIREYDTYNEDEILDLYKSVSWTNYTDRPEMLKNAYEHSLKIFGHMRTKSWWESSE